MIYYLREVNGSLIGFKYNDTTYYYMKNAQNDIIGILDTNLEQIVTYKYDSWGQVISVKDQYGNDITDLNHIAHINSFRYRSYYYDNETGLYYLNSRYYNPRWGRFLNSDDAYALVDENNDGILAYNLYAYAYNNPVNMIDPDGDVAWWIAAAGGGALWGAGIYTIGALINGNFTWGGLGKATAVGAVTGLAFGAAGKLVSKAASSLKIGTSFGKLGTLAKNPGIKANWSKLTIHGAQRMAERGMTKTMVNSVIANGKVLQQGPGKWLYLTKNGAVVMDKTGAIITTYSSKYFDATIKALVKKLF